MTEKTQNLDKNSEVVTDGASNLLESMQKEGWATIDSPNPQVKEEAPVKEQLTPDQRIEVLQEISVLTGVAGAVQYFPHFDNGNNGKQKPKLTKSTPLNLLEYEQMQQVKARIIQLINLL